MMLKPVIKTAERVVPMIYAYSTPEIARHDGWIKIGYTEHGVPKRVKQQGQQIDVETKIEWQSSAIFDDGSGETFTDKHFHAYLRKKGVENDRKNEWFHIDPQSARYHLYDFRMNHGIVMALESMPYELREEQQRAVDMAADYAELHERGEFLWNAKPRFGKTLATYDLCKKMGAKKVLIVTNRPAIANSWYSDYVQFMGADSGYLFVSNVPALKGKMYVLSYEEYQKKLALEEKMRSRKSFGLIEFVSLQDLKGSLYFGGDHEKLRELAEIEWDLLVIDEAHEGVDTFKCDVAFDRIRRKFTLHLSGTPFKALANDKFDQQAIFNWTYADEQKKKVNWDEDMEGPNPYETLPKLNMFTYQMSEIVKDKVEKGIEIDGEQEEYAFDLNLFFETKDGKFVHDASVNRFLDALATQEKFPFSTEQLRNELRHTLWLLNRVDSAKALAEKLQTHPAFMDYEIVLAAGDGKLNNEDERVKSFDKVKSAIKSKDKTITLSVGQLTTGVTIPEWTAVLMLSNVKSPALYMQAAFRAQNPCMFYSEKQYFRKENAYVFDFDPARTLTIFEEFANDLCSETSDGRGDSEIRKKNVAELLNFFPVIGEDENGEMVALDAEKVLTIPRKIHSQEVVRRGFMCDFLFQNISNIFRAPQAVVDILRTFTPVSEPSRKVEISPGISEKLSLNEHGEVELGDEYVIGRAAEIFGDKIYENVAENVAVAADAIASDDELKRNVALEQLKHKLIEEAVNPLLERTQEEYDRELRPAAKKQLKRRMVTDVSRMAEQAFGEFSIRCKEIEQERKEFSEITTPEEMEEYNQEFNLQRKKAAEEFQKKISESAENFVKTATQDIVDTIETDKREQKKKTIEDSIRDHLRGFSRTIPSFLMAYGDDGVTLATFDDIIPDDVFKEVTSISLGDFRYLRDGGYRADPETGEESYFEGKLFDEVVFNDSVQEFLHLKRALADYFNESSTEDIFDYIPPQKTNQIFTPKKVVTQMVDLLEAENPGCFDRPDKTFIDLYMKSGLYITEIVKRLYRSKRMKELFPDGEERLRHIFAEQVYGLAPTEIIYRIALAYILGFNETAEITKHNFVQVDALPYAKDGTLEQKLSDLFNN